MPRRDDIQSIALIGAGPIVIGQACEFDYSGAQACKALREEGYRVVLINSNPATIMTDPDMADATYIEPITPDIVAKILEKEKVDSLLPTMGGQTALNTAMALVDNGTLERLGIRLIGADKAAIEKAEDRQLFRDAMNNIGLESPKSHVVNNIDDAKEKLADIGLPAIIRPSFTLGGSGGGIAYNLDEFIAIVKSGLEASPINEVLVEESVLGWKEYEMEVVRDRNDNAIIICSIENIDPMGVHTGDSVTVAPALTLTDREYQIMRDASIAVLREIGVETGGSNVQFAVNPETGRMVVIEMNPRVSRSSALASKATGFPIAKIAAKLAVGYTLDELKNDITAVTPASFEPSIDYVVTKIPRFAFEKFKGSSDILSTSMKSVGEVMAIGRNFEESLQKALCSMESGLTGLDEVSFGDAPHPDQIYAELAQARPGRILKIAQAFRHGMDVETIHRACHYDRWFLRRIEALIKIEALLTTQGLPESAEAFLQLKKQGFSDERIAKLTKKSIAEIQKFRQKNKIYPLCKTVDSCAAEFKSYTAYMYNSYEMINAIGNHALAANDCPPTDKQKVIILGSGPNRIGQGIEFDYCCVHACFALKELGIESIMINCNPETVSTDYDTADRLYFEPLTFENVMNIIEYEGRSGKILGVIVQLGGQTPLKLAQELKEAGIKILGTDPDSIDLAEDRERFQNLVQKLGILQPLNGLARNKAEAIEIAKRIGFPLVVRPSYVLGGRAMEIVTNINELEKYINEAVEVSGKNPVLLDTYLQNAIELDVDALCDGETVFITGIMEHIEEAGVHSGDSACSLPPFSLKPDMIEKIKYQTEQLAIALNVVGLMNVQFAIMGDKNKKQLYILEVNPRASRTVPFVAKATGTPVAKIATGLMVGKKISDYTDMLFEMPDTRMAIKETVIPFVRFPNTDIILGPEMKSTGEVMGLDTDFARAFTKSQLAVGMTLPREGTAFLSVKDQDKPFAVQIAKMLYRQGFDLMATRGTATALINAGLPVQVINKVMQGQPHIVDALINKEVDFIINTTKGPREMVDSFSLRRKALTSNIPYYTTIAAAEAAVRAITSREAVDLDVMSLQAYLEAS